MWGLLLHKKFVHTLRTTRAGLKVPDSDSSNPSEKSKDDKEAVSEEKVSANLAATSQYVFETLLYNLIKPYTEKFNNFVLVGGCALNVLFNQKLKINLT